MLKSLLLQDFHFDKSHDSHVKNQLVESGIKHHQPPVRSKGMTIGVVGLAKQKGPQYFSKCNFLWGNN